MSVEYNRFTCRWASFDFAHPDEKQLQVIFHFRSTAPEGLRKSFVLCESSLRGGSPEDEDNAYGAAFQVKEALDRYIYNGDKDQIKPVIEYLDSMYMLDEIDKLRAREKTLIAIIVDRTSDLFAVQNEIADAMGLSDYDIPWKEYHEPHNECPF